tara:strand:+ start:171 stop:860 length:690 start_codon:yes stop_codon:yes gene_type:complete
MKYFPLTVIDDFFDDPIEVKNFAESVEYNVPGETNYPGVISKKEIPEMYPQLANWLQQKLMSIFYDQESDLSWNTQMDFQKITPGNFDDQFHILNRGIPHVDTSASSIVLAGLIYLNENPSPDTGTSIFCKKKGCQFYMVPEEVVRFSRKYHSTSDSTEFVNVAEKHLSMFEETVRVQAKFNRMVIYSADDYHAQTTYGVKGGPDRLTLRIFIRNIVSEDDNMPLLRKY